MTAGPTAATRLLALLGDPVEQSLSPAFQNAALRADRRDAVYVALRCDASAAPGLLLGIARAGGGGNVTVPHKGLAARKVEVRHPAVEATGACNTFWLEDGRVHGDNTDVAGFAAAARALPGGSPAGARVLVVGAGGAARAAIAALAEAGAAEVVVHNRTPARAADLLDRLGPASGRTRLRHAAALPGDDFDLAVNATSLGLRPDDPPPIPLDGGPGFGAALDLVYAPGGTRWVRALRERGVAAEDGRRMLLEQGAAAYRRWWDAEAPLDAMRSALAAAASP